MDIFENLIFGTGDFFYQPAELFPSFCQPGEEKEHLFQYSYLRTTFRNFVYVKTSLNSTPLAAPKKQII